MYKNSFSATLKINNKPLRENKDIIAIPYGSEYSIRLHNLNSVRAQAKVSIDGTEVTNGWIVLQPNSKLDLERFIQNGNLSQGNKFKFIERTYNIEKHRGIKEDDGLIRVEFKFEKIYPTFVYPNYPSGWIYVPSYPFSTITTTTPITTTTGTTNGFYNVSNVVYSNLMSNTIGSTFSGWTTAGMTDTSGTIYAMNCCTADSPKQTFHDSQTQMNQLNAVQNNVGITVPGSQSNQQFYSTYDFPCEQSEVIILKLVGEVGNKKVSKPLTVDVKQKCITCGRVNKAVNKFCSECGTALNIF